MEVRVPEGSDVEALVELLCSRLELAPDRPRVVERTWLDTFDWRVHQAGAALELELDVGAADAGGRLRWIPSDDTGAVSVQVDGPPRWPTELPPGRLRDIVAGIVEERALLPLATARCTLRRFRRCNEDDKTVARIAVETAELTTPEGTVPLGTRVSVEPVRGYPRPAARLTEAVEEMLGSGDPDEADGSDSLMRAALAAAGRRPNDTSSKLRIRLKADQRADTAFVAVLDHLLDTILLNHPGTCEDIDPEFLHDLRVAVRRSRSVVRDATGVLPDAVRDLGTEELAWLGTITSTARDLDVHILGFDDLRASLPDPMGEHVEPLRAYLVELRDAEHTALAEALHSPRWEAFVPAWRAALASGPGPDAPERAGRPAHEVAAARIAKADKAVRRLGRSIDDQTPAVELHTLRKKAKRLRYLVECFGSLWSSSHIKPLVADLKGLQENLGEFQDCEVQVNDLRRFAHDMVERGDADADTLLAMGLAVDHLLARQHKAREEFAERFAAFDAKDVRRRFADLDETDDS